MNNDDKEKIKELENYSNDLLNDLQTISNDWETLKIENEALERKINDKDTVTEDIIAVKDNQIKQLQDINKRISEEFDDKEKGKEINSINI